MMKDTLYCTASYANSAHNFEIAGIPNARLRNDDTETGFACVLFNILNRAKKAARPSQYLEKQIGSCDNSKPLFLLSKRPEVSNWERTIKGAENGNNPAYDFFTYYWEKYLPEYAWIRELIRPEADVEIILNDFSGKWDNQSVDFYLAAAKLVIEIDGAQHRERLQAQNDYERDQAFRGSGVTVIRFSLASIRSQDDTFMLLMNQLKELLSTSLLANVVSEQDSDFDDYSKRISYEQAMRYQVLILTLIRNSVISVHQKQWFFNIPFDMQDLLVDCKMKLDT